MIRLYLNHFFEEGGHAGVGNSIVSEHPSDRGSGPGGFIELESG